MLHAWEPVQTNRGAPHPEPMVRRVEGLSRQCARPSESYCPPEGREPRGRERGSPRLEQTQQTQGNMGGQREQVCGL